LLNNSRFTQRFNKNIPATGQLVLNNRRFGQEFNKYIPAAGHYLLNKYRYSGFPYTLFQIFHLLSLNALIHFLEFRRSHDGCHIHDKAGEEHHAAKDACGYVPGEITEFLPRIEKMYGSGKEQWCKTADYEIYGYDQQR
jgi:hypothetical protein